MNLNCNSKLLFRFLLQFALVGFSLDSSDDSPVEFVFVSIALTT